MTRVAFQKGIVPAFFFLKQTVVPRYLEPLPEVRQAVDQASHDHDRIYQRRFPVLGSVHAEF